MASPGRRRSTGLLVLILLALSAAVAVAPQRAAADSTDDPIDRVLAISVDGLNPDAITQLGPTRAPAFHRMMSEGAYTFNARSEYESTLTLPNHTGMVTGRRVDRAYGGHGVTFNDDRVTTVHATAGRYAPSVFDALHDYGGKTAIFASKRKFVLYHRTWVTYGRPDPVGGDHGSRKIDRFSVNEDSTVLVGALNAELQAGVARHFTLLHIALPDLAGHASGWLSPGYLAAVEQTDDLLGQLLDTITESPYLREHMLVLLTADHGGDPQAGLVGHGNAAGYPSYRIPFMAWGPGVPAGADLYEMNPTFADPGTGRPTYDQPPPIRNGNLANLVTDVLDLRGVSYSQFDRARTLTVVGP